MDIPPVIAAPPIPETSPCGYCGHPNATGAAFCSACGSAFPPPIPPAISALPAPVASPTLNAGRAFAVLGLTLGAQILVGIVIGMVAVFVWMAMGKNLIDREKLQEFTQSIVGPANVIALLIGGVVTVVASWRLLPRAELHDSAPAGAAWRVGARKDLLVSLGMGIAIGAVYLLIAHALSFYWPPKEAGPISSMPHRGGFMLVAWIVMAVLLAPPSEELLFRGVFYGGLRRSWGAGLAALITTFIFCAMHVPELMHFPPGILGIAGMAVAALVVRLRFGAIGPAVAVHLGYNSALVWYVLAFRASN